ncbi:MAG: ATP phosphoribosyltransferase regulatory subunit [Pseudomonadota bacterium]
MLTRVEAEVTRLMALFETAGAVRVAPAALQPADTLLDLYGEDIRGRAFVTSDDTGEWMLRPDFTVPVVQRHMAVGAGEARYAYAGPVWRRQPRGTARPREYLQAGFELFGGPDPAKADAEVFALIARAMADRPVQIATGDMGLVLAVIAGLDTSEARRAALRRHLWRPQRFNLLLERFAAPPARNPVLPSGDFKTAIAAVGKPIGTRQAEDVLARLNRLAEDAVAPPIPAAQVTVLSRILALRATAEDALAILRGLDHDMPSLDAAIEVFEARLEALQHHGFDPDTLPFEGAFGRTSMEYYDGFVFGFISPERPDLPVLASGGRYDALTDVLGGAEGGTPAVGAILRPEAILALDPGT